jgi:uncharacterized protein (TIGR03118 family)
MQTIAKFSQLAAFILALSVPSLTFAQHYTQTNLVSDVPAMAPTNDVNLKNAWGLTRSTSSPWWVSDNGTGVSTLYNISGTTTTLAATINARVVVIPPPNGSSSPSTPTGTVFNGSTDFALAPGKPALFIFVTEDGTISGWNPAVDAAHPNNATLKVDNSPNAVYKGVTTGDVKGVRYLYVANFRSGEIEVYDTNFKRVQFSDDQDDHGRFSDDKDRDHHGRSSEESFHDDRIPPGYAPFNVQNIGGSLFVMYAKQDRARHDDVAGEGFGFVDIFSTSGRLEGRLEHGPWLNSPWGVVWAPRDFGEFSNRVLVGNFGSGQIAAFNGFTGKFIGKVKKPDDTTLTIDGLWALAFGNSASAGPYNALFFTAGPNGEADGLFGALTAVPTEQDGDEE